MSTPEPSTDLVPHTFQGALIQQRLNDGYINATAMCKAARKEWANYHQNAHTQDFLTALEGSLGIPRHLIVRSILTGPNEHRGTWIHPQAAIHLAQWLSAEFAVLVSEWVFEWLSGHSATDKIWQQFQDRVSLVYDNVPVGYFCVFREIADVFAALFSKGVNPGTKMILDISVGWHWGRHWTAQGFDQKFGGRREFAHYYPEYFRQSFSNPQPAKCYPEDAVPTFRRWMREVYLPQKFPSYLQTQVQQKRITALAANNTLATIEARERNRALGRPA